jgi:hypothetical protein
VIKKISVVLMLLLISLIIFVSFKEHESYGEESTEFIVNKPFLVVVKELSNKISLEKIIEQNDAVVINKNWDNFDITIPQRILRIREYKIDGTMMFEIKKEDKDLGEIFLPFVQQIKLNKNEFKIETKLKNPQKNVIHYYKLIEINPIKNESKTHIMIKSDLKIKRTIPIFFEKIMNDKVEKINKNDIENLKQNILLILGPNINIHR